MLVGRVKPLSDEYIRPVIAVSSFDNKSGFSGQWSLGTGMADLLVSELVGAENFIIVERKYLNEVVGELEMQSDKYFRAEGKISQGRLKNARYFIRGVINDFSQVGGGSLGIAFRKLLFGGKGYKARVALTLTIVDIENGEIIDSVQAEGTARAGETYVKGNYKDVSFGGDQFFKTPLGVATSNALRRGIKGLVEKMPRTEWQPMIAAVIDNGRIIINGGDNREIEKDTIFCVRGEGVAVNDPVTGDVIKIVPGSTIGSVKVTEVEDTIAYAEVVDGDAKSFARGMVLINDLGLQ